LNLESGFKLSMLAQKERTLVMIKPDGVQRSLVGEIISRFERVGLKFIAMKMFIPTEKQIAEQYGPNKQELEALGQRSIDNQAKLGVKIKESSLEQGTKIFNALKKYLSSGPVVGIVLEGNQAVGIVRKLVGATEPLNSDVGTIRGDFTIESYNIADTDGRAVRNLVHRSGSIEEAQREIKIWFGEKELLKYKLISESILYDVNLDGILE